MFINNLRLEIFSNILVLIEKFSNLCIRKTLQADYRKGLVREASLFPILKV